MFCAGAVGPHAAIPFSEPLVCVCLSSDVVWKVFLFKTSKLWYFVVSRPTEYENQFQWLFCCYVYLNSCVLSNWCQLSSTDAGLKSKTVHLSRWCDSANHFLLDEPLARYASSSTTVHHLSDLYQLNLTINHLHSRRFTRSHFFFFLSVYKTNLYCTRSHTLACLDRTSWSSITHGLLSLEGYNNTKLPINSPFFLIALVSHLRRRSRNCCCCTVMLFNNT